MTTPSIDGSTQPTKQPIFKIGKISWLLILLTLFLLPSIYLVPMAKHLRAKYLGKASLERAKAFMAEKNWAKAGAEFRTALQLLPDDPEVLRELVKVLDKTQNHGPLLRNALLKLRELKSENESDAILLARILLKEGQIGSAREAYNALNDIQRETPLAETLQADISVAEGNKASLEGLMHPEVKEAIALYRNPFSELQDKGTRTLWKLSQTSDERSLQAINFLAASATLTEKQTGLLIQRLETHSKKSLPVLLGVYSSLMRNLPAERERTLKKLILEHRNDPLNDLRTFLQWLSLEGESKLLRSMISEETLYSDPAVFTAYAQSFLNRGHWAELLNLLNQPAQKYPISSESMALFRAKALSHVESDGENAKTQFYIAINSSLAAQNTDMLQLIGKEAADLYLWDICELAHSKLAELNPPLALSALQKSLEATTRQRDTSRILRIVTQLTKLQGSDPAYYTQLCYIRLLQGSEIENLALPSTKQAEPSILAFLQALKAYRFLDTISMNHFLLQITDLNSLNDGQKAVYAGLLRKAGYGQKSDEIATAIIPQLILPEERWFLKPTF
ncbi:MAG: hypothetical protein NTV80_21820 [Verrucomicrobia bacterium]|nr:hypothetical protein [Verrucomicrobiota bacterium]